MTHHINTEIQIDVPAHVVWDILFEFEAYPSWNPFLTSMSGSTAEGEKLEIVAGGMAFSPIVQVKNVNKHFEWKGQLFIPKLFDGIHSFQLIEIDESSCLFCHSERFNGMLVPLFRSRLDTDIKIGFESMNLALKKRAEERWRA